MSKHTPGPWSADGAEMEQDADSVFTIGIGSSDKHVATVAAFELILDDDGSIGPTDATQAGLDEARANARLIASAPDLLEALQAMVKEFGFDVVHPHGLVHDEAHAIQRAMEVIAKATGND